MGQSLLIGLIGDGIGQSRSPYIHETEAQALGLPLSYRLIDFAQLGLGVKDLGDALAWLQRLGFAGTNITHPYKQAVIPHLDSLSRSAADIGAVNTVVLRDGKRIGHNTDWSGYRRAFHRAMPQADLQRVVQIGAGGAAAAVGYALLDMGVETLAIHDLIEQRAEDLAGRLSRLFPDRRVRVAPAIAPELAGATGLVQTSPVGMAAHPGSPIEPDLLRPNLWVSEIIYFPRETQFLASARALGCATVDGVGMAVFQAADAFRLFTELEPDSERMLRMFC